MLIAGVLLTKGCTWLMLVVLVQALVTYLYTRLVEKSFKAFTHVPLELATKMDEHHRERNLDMLQNDIVRPK